MMELLENLEPLYRDWNSKINVISRKDMDSFYTHHVLHSLAIARYLSLNPLAEKAFSEGRILDLGTGGGFPGIPLAIHYPGARFTLCDSVGKKTLVAGEVAKSLGLNNVEIVNARAESLEGGFDFVVSRAVAPLDRLYGWTRGKFARSIICLKGGDINAEIADLCKRFRLDPSRVSVWPVSSAFDDPWFEGKMVVEVRND